MIYVVLAIFALQFFFGYIAARWIVHRLERDSLARIEVHVLDLLRKEHHMQGVLEAIQAQVAESIGIEASAVTLLKGLHQALVDAIATNNLSVLQGLASDLKTGTDALVAAMQENALPTPAADPPPAPTPDAPAADPNAPPAIDAPAPDAAKTAQPASDAPPNEA